MDNKRRRSNLTKKQRRELYRSRITAMNEFRLQKKLLKTATSEPSEPEEPIPEPRFGFKVPSPSELTEGRGKRSCRIQQCAFKSCPTNSTPPEQRDEVTFFRFPNNFYASVKWARTVSRERGETFLPKLTSAICALHFRFWETHVESGQTRVLPKARPRPQPYSQEEQQREIEWFEKRKEEIVKREEERKRQEKNATVVLPSFVPEVPDLKIKEELLDSDNFCTEFDTTDGFGNTLPVEINPLKIEETTELERAVQGIANELAPAENSIMLQYLDLNNQSATVHYLSVDSGNIVSVGHTQVDIQTDNVATLNYVDSDNTVKHTLRCVNIEEDPVRTDVQPSLGCLTGKDMSINENLGNAVASSTSFVVQRTDIAELNTKVDSVDKDQNLKISNPISLSTNNGSVSECVKIKVEPITNDELMEEMITIETEKDEIDSETVIKMEIEELEEPAFKLI